MRYTPLILFIFRQIPNLGAVRSNRAGDTNDCNALGSWPVRGAKVSPRPVQAGWKRPLT